MTDLKHLTVDELQLDEYDSDQVTAMEKWLARGDGIAVYENHDLGHPELGHRQLLSYGSEAAQLETDTPPERLPDFPGTINWRYTLIGVYREPTLS